MTAAVLLESAGRLALQGVVDMHSGAALRQKARGALARIEGAQVLLDCSAVADGSSSVCLSLLLCMQRDAVALGKRLQIAGLPVELQRIAGMYGLLEVLPLDVAAG